MCISLLELKLGSASIFTIIQNYSELFRIIQIYSDLLFSYKMSDDFYTI
jgi:hypothetical protein